MADSVADQFKGLPIEHLIGAPLDAAVKANVNLAQSCADFINKVGFYQNDVKIGDKTYSAGMPRMLDFSFERPGLTNDGLPSLEKVTLSAPMLAIVPIPNLQIDTVDITFDMEVKSSSSEKSSSDEKKGLDASAKVGWGPFAAEVKVSGSVSSHKENARSSDNSAKYHVEVRASNHGMPEGLSRVLDIFNQSIKPTKVEAQRIGPDGKPDKSKLRLKPDGTYEEAQYSGTNILNALTSSNSGTFKPVFTSATSNYTLEVAANVKNISLTPTAAGKTIKINGIVVTSGTASNTITLNDDIDTAIRIDVLTLGGIVDDTTKTYTVTVKRVQTQAAKLSSIRVSAGTLTFEADKTSYDVTIPVASAANFTITPVASNTTDTIKVDGATTSSDTAATITGIPATAGATKNVSIVVSGADKTTTTYTVKITVATA